MTYQQVLDAPLGAITKDSVTKAKPSLTEKKPSEKIHVQKTVIEEHIRPNLICDEDDIIFGSNGRLSVFFDELPHTDFKFTPVPLPHTTDIPTAPRPLPQPEPAFADLPRPRPERIDDFLAEQCLFSDFDRCANPPPIFDQTVPSFPGSRHRPVLPIDTLFPTDDMMLQTRVARQNQFAKKHKLSEL